MPMPRSLGSSQVTFLPEMKIWPPDTSSKPGDAVEQGRLAATRGPEQDEELALLDVEVHILEDLDRPEVEGQVPD